MEEVLKNHCSAVFNKCAALNLFCGAGWRDIKMKMSAELAWKECTAWMLLKNSLLLIRCTYSTGMLILPALQTPLPGLPVSINRINISATTFCGL